ncbi:type I restriction-modification system subunit M [Dictyobacter aurantiacus]|uniref:site-specific DNA-methyltransferase (adenine-specific) n=1 Tax=Dictyobacter aurantiacus TaxID=1936993 RepID=A0A401ZD65_9CHLR|nr:class I SAM-dependent DNA methyltransferase [Dictyobacter aurantiacus]GCE04792.1 membrane protein [Dictyobacter aurantiacus]
MSANTTELEKRLWASADSLRANSKLRSSEYSVPVLGLIFLRFADQKFTKAQEELEQHRPETSRRRTISKLDYQAQGVLYLPENARFSYLLSLPESEDIGKAINDAMKAIEAENDELSGVLPKTYTRLEKDLLIALLKTFSGIPMDTEGDFFGKVYEYFLSKFAMSEGQRGGEFFTPTSLVKLIVEIIEPFQGLILDPACGSGGMFVQSARFVAEHRLNPGTDISIYGQEKTSETARLCRMNLAVHGLSGDIRQTNTYYENAHNCTGRFDFVMANPPFNVNGVDKEKVKGDKRYIFGLPRVDNANYLWIQEFYTALNERGRAGFVMANSAGDARGSEQEIRTRLIQANAVDVMISIGSNFFYTVTLPCTLWFFDKGKRTTERRDKVLFIDARSIYYQVDRAHRDFTPEHIERIANIVRLYRGEEIENRQGSLPQMQELFPENTYKDIAGLCRVATLTEIEAQGWSLNPGRYVGVAERAIEDFDFKENLETLNEELNLLNAESYNLELLISENIISLLEVQDEE